MPFSESASFYADIFGSSIRAHKVRLELSLKRAKDFFLVLQRNFECVPGLEQ